MQLSVKDLSFRYPGAAGDTLHSLNFTVAPGEIFGFLGPSGAGKSTTQKIMIGLLRDYRGGYEIDGRSAQAWRRELYEHIGVVFEQPNLYAKFSALENLNYFSSFYRRESQDASALLNRLGLGDAIHRRVDAYSKGMRTRLNLARALLHKPEILFLDEPTSGLDPANARMVMELIKEERGKGKTIFLTTHNMLVADELCDRLGFLADGKLLRVAPPRELKIGYGERTVTVEYLREGELKRSIYPLDGIGVNSEFLQLLAQAKEGEIESIRSGEASLETVFLTLTGKHLV